MKITGMYLIPILLSIAACGTTNVRNDFSTESLVDTGLIVVSVTQNNSDKGYQGFSSAITGLTVFYENINSGKKSYIDTDPWMLGSMASGDFNDTEGRGKLFVIELEPGQYAFQGWYATQGAYTSVTPKKPKRFLFGVEAGEVIYTGELGCSLIYGKNVFGIGVIADVEQSVIDSEMRDIGVLKEKYPKLDTGKIIKRLLVEEGNPLSEGTNKETNYIPSPVE